MARLLVISQRSNLRGVFTQKKKLWETMGFEDKNLKVAVSATKMTDLKYTTLCKYISDRKSLQIYDPNDIEEAFACNDDLSEVNPEYMIWELDTNTYYNPKVPNEDDEDSVIENFRDKESEDEENNREKFHI